MSSIQELQVNHVTADVTLTDGVESVAVSSGGVILPYQTAKIVIVAWAQVSLAASTTGLTPRIRRGTGITGTTVGDATIVLVTASTIVEINIMVSEDRANEGSVEYSLTLLDTAGGDDGTILQSSIMVYIL